MHFMVSNWKLILFLKIVMFLFCICIESVSPRQSGLNMGWSRQDVYCTRMWGGGNKVVGVIGLWGYLYYYPHRAAFEMQWMPQHDGLLCPWFSILFSLFLHVLPKVYSHRPHNESVSWLWYRCMCMYVRLSWFMGNVVKGRKTHVQIVTP